MKDVVASPLRITDQSRVTTYYNLPSLKPSLWGWLVSSYIFIAGIGGSAQIIATGAAVTGDRSLRPIVRKGRYIAFGAVLAGGPLLIIDLRTPQRWYNMLRIFRRTSPMSIGTYVLISFGTVSAALAGAQFAEDRGMPLGRITRTVIKALQVPATLTGMAMCTYTAALLSATSTPLWAAAPRRLGALFGASAIASGAAALQIATSSEAGGEALDGISLLASAVELALSLALRDGFREQGLAGALQETGWSAFYDLGVVGVGAGLPLLHYAKAELSSGHSRERSLLIPLMVLAGGFLLRHLVLKAGNVSAKRPRDYFRFASVAKPPCRCLAGPADERLCRGGACGARPCARRPPGESLR
jgi:formate-dependent nitrite reductase membrane component NrfD